MQIGLEKEKKLANAEKEVCEKDEAKCNIVRDSANKLKNEC